MCLEIALLKRFKSSTNCLRVATVVKPKANGQRLVWTRFAICFLVLFSLLLPGAVWANPPFSTQDLARLRQGHVVVHHQKVSAPSRQNQNTFRAAVLIDRPADQVWQIVSDPVRLFQGAPTIQRVRVLSGLPGKQQTVEYVMDVSPMLPRYQYVAQVHYQSPYTARFKRIRGSFKDFEGLCHLTPINQGKQTLLHYQLQLDLGMWVPDPVTRFFIQQDLPKMLGHVQQTVYHQYPQVAASPGGKMH
ncbi:MAG: SRPBCC family protein [Candidatus Melainabacteria bacterium]|nr:SRPBCC family protein [Candidatus Melainabacteria bacterium]